MKTIRSLQHLVFATLTLLAAAHAGQAEPRVGYAYPAGGQPGTSFTVTLGGQYLDGVANAYFSGTGISATVIDHIKPLTAKLAAELKEKLQELQDKRNGTNGKKVALSSEEEALIAEIRLKLATFVAKALTNPALGETVTLKVTVAADAEPGERDLRLRTPQGLTNPRLFYVGQLPEFTKNPAKIVRPSKNAKYAEFRAPEYETEVTVPATINGQIMPGGTDRFRFKARQGQRLVFAVNARQLHPYLPDAVPGWFQAALSLYDPEGNEIAYADHFEFHPDPVIYYEIPLAGEYVAEVKDTLYRGREDFVYRITVGEIPFVTGIFPLGGPIGKQTEVELKGWNLPFSSLTLDESKQTPGIRPFSVIDEEVRIAVRGAKPDRPAEASLVSNRVPFAVDNLPECLEKEPNDSIATAQAITLPMIVNGHIDRPGDWDVFRFDARAGTDLVAEVYARRLNSPLDSVLKLTDAAGKQLAFNDDHEDKGSGLNTYHADSYLRFTLPTSGTYYLHLGDTLRKGGPDYAYRLRVSVARPDFALRIVPSSISAKAGTQVPLTVFALRQDGFAKEIALSLKDAPPGYALTGATVPADQDKVQLTLMIPATAGGEPLHLNVEGHASIQGRDTVRTAVPADDMMQAFAYHHLVTAQTLDVLALNRGFFKAGSGRLLSDGPVRIPAGGIAHVRVDTSASPFAAKAEYELSDPPDGVTLQKVTPSGNGLDLTLQTEAGKIKPGQKGNLIVSVYSTGFGAFAKDASKGAKRKIALGALPAIPYEIVAR